MVGHTFAAAGGVGLLRTILAMRARTLPPSTHVTTLNPKLPLADIPGLHRDRASHRGLRRARGVRRSARSGPVA